MAAREPSTHWGRRRRRRTASLLGVIPVLALALAVPGSASAACVPGVVGQSSAFTVVGETCYTVPGGVTELNVVAVGAAGTTVFAGTAGNGTQITTQLSVTPGETFWVEVGVGGGVAAPGGGDGGGASEIVTCSVSVSACSTQFGTSTDPRLVIAAGGGGNGYGGFASNGGAARAAGPGTVIAGNDGNDICVPGASGTTVVVNQETSGGGGGGTCTGGGTAGVGTSGTSTAESGAAGAVNQGGGGGGSFNGGGGGGGGYYGGGGGAGPTSVPGDGGGAGGGSSLAPLAATISTTSSTSPSVTIAAVAGLMSLGATSLTFTSTQPQATVSSPKSLTITNNGNAPVQIAGLTFTGADPQDFLISSDGCMGSVAAGASCQLGVSFAPQAQGARTATLQIASNDPASPATVALSGTGGQLPQGPAGATGATGPAGKNGVVELVTCRTVTIMVTKTINDKRKKVKVKRMRCTTKTVSGAVKFTTARSVAQAILVRAGTTYATGLERGRGRHTNLGLVSTRRLTAGRYTLILIWTHGRRRGRVTDQTVLLR